MRRLLPILVLAFPATSWCAETPATPVDKNKLPAISLLPDGSQLKGVMLPRYDENRKLIGVLKAKAMTLVNSQTVAGDAVSIEFFNDDQSPRGRIDLIKATFFQEKGLISATENVSLKSDRLTANGSGLYYTFGQGRGYLTGPVTTVIKSIPSPAR